jgi:hypothetical protein
MTNIVDYAFDTFPTKDEILIEFKNHCIQCHNINNWNWKNFVKNLSNFLFIKDTNITITKSTTWAVCQEFLGNLSGKELHYAQSRGGLWALRINKNDKLENNEDTEKNNEDTEQNVEVISVRRVFNDLRNKYN